MTEHQIAARLERWRLERDPAALGELLKAHRDRAYSVAARLLGPGEDAEDAVQEACLKLLSRTHGFEGPESFRAAVYRAVVQCGLNALRGRRRGRNLLEAARRDARTGEPSMPTPETASGEAELREIVRLAIEELPEDLRVAVMLCYLEGLRLNEAAEALEIPRQTLRDRLERAVGLLRADLARSGATFAPALLAGASMAAPAALLAKLDAALPGAPCAELAPVGPAPRAGDPFAAARAGRRGLAAAVAAALLLAMLAVGALLESRPRQQDAAAPAPPAAPVPAEIAAVVPLPEPAQPSDERNPEMNAQQLALTLAAAMALPAARAEEPAQPPAEAAPAHDVAGILARIRAYREAKRQGAADLAVFEAADNVKFFARDMKDDSGSAAPVRILVSKTIEMLGDGLDPIDGMGMGMGLWERKLDEALPPNATPGTRVIIRRFQGEAGAQAAPEAHKPAAPPPQPEKKE